MEGLYEEIIERVRQGAKCKVDYKNPAIFLNNKEILTDQQPLGIGHFKDLDEWLDKAEILYDEYKYSRPTKSSMSKERKCKFKALSVEQLTEELGHLALTNPTSRDEALAALEVFIVLSLIDGTLDPNELFAKDWYYQGADKMFIIKKDWFNNQNNNNNQ